MKLFSDALKVLKPWQIGLLAFVLAGAIGATYGAYILFTKPGQENTSGNQQLIPVQYGNLVNQVSINGSLLFPNRETLTFGTQGTIGQVLVEEGQTVKEGQTLASLDSTTVATLKRAVAQARVTLRDAEEALEKVKNPNTAFELAQAEASVANAKLTQKNAEEALAKLLEPTSQVMAQAKSAVTSAKLSAENASKALEALKTGATEEDTAKAQSQIDSADTLLANAQRDLKLIKTEWEGKIKAAQDGFDTATASYKGVLKKWFGVEIANEAIIAPGSLLSSWGADLATLYDPDARFQVIGGSSYTSGIPSDNPATPWNEVTVYAWLNLYPGRIAVTCETGVIPVQGVCIQKELDDEWTRYQQAKDTVDTVQTQQAKAVASAESTVTRSQDSLATAKNSLADLKADPDPLEIESKKSQVEVTLATLEKAEEDLAKLLGEPDPLDVETKEKQIAVAKASLAKAEEDLAELKGSVDSLIVVLREAEVASAQQALETATQRQADATLKSPLTGIVSLVNVEAGQAVSANTPIVEVVDPTTVEVDGTVGEIDVLSVKEGARADVTLDALSGRTLQGTVSTISSAARNQQGVVNYPIRITIQVPQGIQLREGLSATASIVLREELNVLLVPLQALYGTFEKPVVKVRINGVTEERPVVLGNSDDYWVAVRQGLAEGEQVLMESQRATAGQFGFGQAFRQFQGQFPGAPPGGPGGAPGGQRQQQQQQRPTGGTGTDSGGQGQQQRTPGSGR
ncbi:MAG: HlyD family efflux transporter periplasmic adaptor subunit [Chloroflexi bacterium]|nr:HlyD family efflux transporter periplasmic adaptor subunit [Chloroflexota bacterium]